MFESFNNPFPQKDQNILLEQVLAELRIGDYSIFKRNRRKDLKCILELDYKDVPVEFPNLVFKRLVEKKGKNCPIPLIGFCMKCLGYYFLKINGLGECNVDIVKDHDSLGRAIESGIEISKCILPSLRKGHTDAFETLFHEINHEIQMKKKAEPELSFATYEWLQDTLLFAFIGDSYYLKNYEKVSMEVDSRIRGGVLAYRYLKEISPKAAEKMKRRVYRNAQLEIENTTSNRKVGGLFTTREALFDEFIKKKSEILLSYPFLKRFYHEDGAKRTLAEVLLEYKGMRDQKIYYEVRYTKDELRENEDYKSLLTRMAFYSQFLKNRSSSYDNVKNDYLSITVSNIPFLEACAKDEWLEVERDSYLTKFEKKYASLSQLRTVKASLLEDALSSINPQIDDIERVCLSFGNLGILKRTVISFQRLKNQSIKKRLSKIQFTDKPKEDLGVTLKQSEINIRK